MRGFSIIEILIAFSILTMLVIGVSATALSAPAFVANAVLRETAIEHAREVLGNAYMVAASTSSLLVSIATTTSNGFNSSLQIKERDSESFKTSQANVSWDDVFGRSQTITLGGEVEVPSLQNDSCDTFVSGDWSHPQELANYSIPEGTVAALAATPSTVIIGIRSSLSAQTPTILFKSVHGTNPEIITTGEFDTSSTSKIGVGALATKDSYVFVGNAFGSKSADTCADRMRCAQVQVFTTSPTPKRAGNITLSTTSEPYASLATGESAPVTGLTYYQEYLYVGLQKTARGSEFNIIDAHNPEHLRWVSGYRVGRTISHITVRGSLAYLSTDDPAQELVILDIFDPTHPRKVGSWDAPGAIGFGYGTASTVRDTFIRFGKSYSSNSPELVLLDSHAPSNITQLAAQDSGTPKDTESVRALLQQDTLLFTLLSHRLEFWDTHDPQILSSHIPAYALPTGADGAALVCRDNLLYVAWNTGTTGTVRVLKSS